MRSALRVLLPLLLAVAFVAQLRRSSDLMKAQHLLWGVERRTLAMLRSGDMDPVKLRGHLAALADARRFDPAEVAVPTLQGSQHLMLAETEPARRAYYAANQLEPRPEILVNLGKVNYSIGAQKRAVTHFAQAVLLDPRLLKEVPPDLQETVSDALRRHDNPYRADEDGEIQP
jgi:hypothetical protein